MFAKAKTIIFAVTLTFSALGHAGDSEQDLANEPELLELASLQEQAVAAGHLYDHDEQHGHKAEPKIQFVTAGFFGGSKVSEGQKILDALKAKIASDKKYSQCTVKSNGVSRVNTVKERCQPARDVFSCHLIDKAVDVIFTGTVPTLLGGKEKCGPALVRAIGANYVDYDDMKHLHVGYFTVSPSCFLGTRGMAPGGDAKNWCACAKGKFGKDFECTPGSIGAAGIIGELVKRKWPW